MTRLILKRGARAGRINVGCLLVERGTQPHSLTGCSSIAQSRPPQVPSGIHFSAICSRARLWPAADDSGTIFAAAGLDGFQKFIEDVEPEGEYGNAEDMKEGIVGDLANDRWIAKLVGKITRLLKTVRGDMHCGLFGGYTRGIGALSSKTRRGVEAACVVHTCVDTQRLHCYIFALDC